MRIKSIQIILLVSLLFSVACSYHPKHTDFSIQTSSFQIYNQAIPITVSLDNDEYFNQLGHYLKLTSYVKLAAEPLLATLQQIQIEDDRIYVVDRLNRMVCYDMIGKVIFQIHEIGNGPGEYNEINSFTINSDRNELVIYDNIRSSLLYYSADNGKFLKSEKLEKPNPSEMAFFDGRYFYNNRDHKNYPNDSLYHYSLLSSKDGHNIEQTCFPHNDDEEAYRFSPSLQTFYRNDNKLYYCKNFDHIVYRLNRDSVISCYNIALPNPLPTREIEKQADEYSLLNSDYSFGISNVFESDHLLYFRFFNKRFIHNVLYDLRTNEQICCVKSLQEKPNPKVPLLDIINGVYKNQFFGILSPDFIQYWKEKYPSDLPDIFRDYDASSDNPVIVFCSPF